MPLTESLRHNVIYRKTTDTKQLLCKGKDAEAINLAGGLQGLLHTVEGCVAASNRAGIILQGAKLIEYVREKLGSSELPQCEAERVSVCVCEYCRIHYPRLLQVAVHSLSDVCCMNGIMIGILGVVVILHHTWQDRRRGQPFLTI